MVVPAKPRGLWSRLAPLTRLALIVLVILLLASGAYVVYDKVNTCGPDVDWIDGQCIGVTDGSVPLSPEVADVLDKIEEENARVDSSGRAVLSVAYLLGLPAPASNEAFVVSLRHELQGAYLALHRANLNRSQNEEPLLRLLVANDGDRAQHWEQVTATLVDKVNGPEQLVAVIATGRTLDGRQRSIAALTAEDLPVIASRLTGDDLIPAAAGASTVQGLVRLVPSNSDQSVAAAAYLKEQQPAATRALLVQNIDPDDAYSASLGKAFRQAFPDEKHKIVEPPEIYNPRRAGVERTMPEMLVNICYRNPDIIFFAGRSTELAAFIKALPNRPCPEIPINIVTADDAVDFAYSVTQGTDDLDAGMQANSSVRYTALAHPGSWEASPQSFPAGSRDVFRFGCKDCYQSIFRDDPLDDGGAIMGYDAIITVVTAIYSRQGINDTPALIIEKFNRMRGPSAVPGAGGWISFDERGDPVNKAVPILEVRPDEGVVFMQLSSPGWAPDDPPGGSPCRPNDPALC